MKARLNKHRFPLGLVFFALGFNVCKAAMITASIGAGGWTFVVLLGLDLFYFSLLLFIAILQGFLQAGLLRKITGLALVLMTGVYLTDSFVLLALDDHPTLFDIGRYSLKWAVVLSFFDVRACTVILLFLVSLLYFRAFTPVLKKITLTTLAAALICSFLATVYAPPLLARYAMFSPTRLLESFPSQPTVSSYSVEEMDFYGELARVAAEIPPEQPNIILLIVESLSSINSMKVSGRGSLLARFDELAEEGLLFRNFFANHQASEGGIISLLGGFPPMHFPTASPYMFDEFAHQPSVTDRYRQQGYFMEFLTNSDLHFIGLDHFLGGIRFDRSRGRDEVEAMRQAPRIVQDAPADDLLYVEALSTIRRLSIGQQPFMLVLATTSTHLPYIHPQGGPNNAAAVWDWSLQQAMGFYRGLLESEYFNRGILLITGDHRQMRPLTQVETERYGDSARARVPLLVIGKNYAQGGIDDRFLQQSDLLRRLARLKQADAPLSPHPIWVERYNRKYGRVEYMDRLSVFDQQNEGRQEYRLKVLGKHIEWLGEKPAFARSIETRIHTQRSLHQKIRNGTVDRCQPRWPDAIPLLTNRHGLALGIFEQSGLDGLMDIHGLPADRRWAVKTVAMDEFSELSGDSALLFTGFLNIEKAGVYRFRVGAGQTACMSLDKALILDQPDNARIGHEISVELTVGSHFLDLRFVGGTLRSTPVLEWVMPGSRHWRWRSVPSEGFYLGL